MIKYLRITLILLKKTLYWLKQQTPDATALIAKFNLIDIAMLNVG